MDRLRLSTVFPRDGILRSFVQLVPQLPLQADRIPCPLPQQHLYLGLAEPKPPRQVADSRIPLHIFGGSNSCEGLVLHKTAGLRIDTRGPGTVFRLLTQATWLGSQSPQLHCCP